MKCQSPDEAKMYWVNVVMLAAVTSALPAIGRPDKHPPRTRVYVFTAESPGGVVSDEEQGRLDSVRDVRDALGHRSEFTLVATAADAQVRVEIVNREERDVPEGGFGGKTLTRFRETLVRLRVETANDKGELKGAGRPSWKDAAKDAAERVAKWVKSHPPAPASLRP
jgi:hypothetical protein